jgi:DNA-binding response OmpR family regulator
MSSRPKILVVDDDPETVGLIELTLKPAGFHLEHAYNGNDALELVKANEFDLILLDIMMPELSGFDMVEQLRETSTSIPPIIFLTARGRQKDIEMGRNLGASSYLVKPATRGQLLDAINAALYEASPKDNASD